MSNREHYCKLERMYLSGPLNRFFCPKITVDKGACELILDVRPDFFHAAHAVHGSVYFKMLDDSAYFAVSSLVTDVFVLTASFNLYITRPVSDGEMKAAGKVVHRSQRLYIAESVLVNSDGKEIARGSGTFMRSTIQLSPELGYE